MNSQLLLVKWKNGSFHSWYLSWNLFFFFFFGKKRSKIRKRIIHGRALYTGKYGIQNVALLKQHIFLIRENWSILLLSNRRNFRVFCLNSASLKPTFHFVWKKARYFAESIWKICLKGPFFTENAILENTK